MTEITLGCLDQIGNQVIATLQLNLDLREGILPGKLIAFVRKAIGFEHIHVAGIGTNLACRSGVAPDTANMSELSALADQVERILGLRLAIVSGGNSANLKSSKTPMRAMIRLYSSTLTTLMSPLQTTAQRGPFLGKTDQLI